MNLLVVKIPLNRLTHPSVLEENTFNSIISSFLSRPFFLPWSLPPSLFLLPPLSFASFLPTFLFLSFFFPNEMSILCCHIDGEASLQVVVKFAD